MNVLEKNQKPSSHISVKKMWHFTNTAQRQTVSPENVCKTLSRLDVTNNLQVDKE
jgi:hypothetical protein